MMKYVFCPEIILRRYFMKLLLLKIKMFFSQPEVKLFFKVLFISAPIVGCTSYYAYPYMTWIFERQDIKETYAKMEEIIAMPKSTNDNTIYDTSYIINPESYPPIQEDKFWVRDALDYRYTVPKHGTPKN